jgi:hypothetical protein
VKAANAKIVVEAKNAEEAVMALRDYKNSKERLGLDWRFFVTLEAVTMALGLDGVNVIQTKTFGIFPLQVSDGFVIWKR